MFGKKGTGAVRVEGLRELERGLRATDNDAAKELRKALREAGKVVALEARRRHAFVSTRSAMGIRPRIRSGLVVYAEQSRRKTTGQHPEFGAIVMQGALLPAKEAKTPEVKDMVEQAITDATERNF